jgi:2-hydroxychromene-2-carboxylate isomerase
MLKRNEVVDPQATAFLAEWVESLRGQPSMQAFAAAALTRLWLNSSGAIEEADFASLFREIAGHAPPKPGEDIRRRLADNHLRQLRKGHWESPAARVEGEWFFAHERVPQIEERLTYLGW